MIYFIFLLSMFQAFAHEAGETEAQIGEGKAVEAYDPHLGIRISEKSKELFSVKTSTVIKGQSLPPSAIVRIQDRKTVYIEHDGRFKLIDMAEAKPGDKVVSSGAALVRVAEMNVAGDEEHTDDEHGEEKEEGHEDEHGHDHGDDHD